MSRYCGEKNPAPILNAATHWRDTALTGGGSVFGAEHLWTTEAIDALFQYFVERPDVGNGTFIGKLQEQLAPTNSAAKKLAAEMMWLMYLCPSSLTPTHKRKTVGNIWSWSGVALPDASLWLAEPVLTGIGSAGPGFNQNQWRELAFVVNFMRAFRKLSATESDQLLADPWAFSEWLQSIPESASRQFRHMLLFLLFPDDFERIFAQRDRKAIARAFSGLQSQVANSLSAVDLDRTLRDIRRQVETEYHTTKLDFYLPPLVERWQPVNLAAVAVSITADHVRQALDEIDRDGIPLSAQSTGYDLIEAGRRYPPKLVLSLASKYANGQELDRSYFSGGIDSQAFKILRDLGFEIAAKELITPLVTRFLEQAKAATDLTVQSYLDEYRGLRVRVSFGQGNVARIPWIAFLGKDQLVSNGIYPVLLFFRERNVLLLCYGVSETNIPERTWELATDDTQTVAEWFSARYGTAPDRYGQSFVRTAFDLNNSFDIELLKRELDLVIDSYEEVMDEPDAHSSLAESLPARADLGEASDAFAAALKNSFVDFGEFHASVVTAFLTSIVAKPLVILTGLSGSGKTQIALKLGEWFGDERLEVAAVRPDWTGAEALFGYEDGLKPAVEGRAAWVVTKPLAFILKAAADPAHPYLLLLDEMNLAHVERYFADVLSGMESGRPCLPNLIQGSDGLWRVRAQGTDRIPLPRNLWIVGTVNVDETTYMFSPKVLDRANTFEFRVSSNDLRANIQKPVPCTPGDPELIRGLMHFARDDAWQLTNPATFQDSLGTLLKQLHVILARFGLEFGHRMFYESLRFAALAEKAGLSQLNSVLDCVVMQKVLPRLHGSRRRLELPLLALAQFCRDMPDTIATDENLPSLKIEQLADSAAKLPRSYDKLCRMLRSLRANQFASFTE